MTGIELHLKTALRVICLFVMLDQCGSAFYESVPKGSKGVKLKCKPEFIQVLIYRSNFHYLDPGTFRVGTTNTKTCKPYHINETMIMTKIPLNEHCGTVVTDYADVLKFTSVMYGEVYWNPFGITRYPDHIFQIECLYFRTAKLTLKSFTPDDKIIVRPPTFGKGKFKFTMEMFKTEAYKEQYTKYPVRVDLNERIFLQVRTYKNYNNLILFLENCRATLSSNPNDKRNHTLIGNGCPSDPTVNLKQGATNYQRFSLKTFRFITKNGIQSVYLHCEILMCFKANKQSRCMRDCRKKRSPLVSDNVKLGNKKYIATLGPLRAPPGNDSAPTPGKNVSGSDVGAIVYCDSDYMRLYIDRATYPYIDPTSFALNATGKGCNLYTTNRTHVVSMIPLDRCGTIVNEYADLLTFYNNLNTEVTNTKTGITRHPAVEFRFECSYFRTSTKSLVAFNPKGRIVTKPTAETGNFTFTMDMFQTDKFLSPYTHYPVKVHLKERIFFQVKMEGNTSDLVLFLENCRATPTNSMNDTKGYEIIRNGCPIDSSLNLKQGDEPKQHFSLSAFRFIPGVSDVYLHCQVLVCHQQNKNSRCNANCTDKQPALKPNSQILRLKRDSGFETVSVTNVTELETKKYVTSLGPIRILIDEAGKPKIKIEENGSKITETEDISDYLNKPFTEIGMLGGCSVTSYGWTTLLFSAIVVMVSTIS